MCLKMGWASHYFTAETLASKGFHSTEHPFSIPKTQIFWFAYRVSQL